MRTPSLHTSQWKGITRSYSSETWFSKLTQSNPQNLPRLPIPKLEDTIKRYLLTLQPLVSAQDYQAHEKLVNDFLKKDGKRLQEKLIQQDGELQKSGKYPSSYIEKEWDMMYLGGRYPSPINVNPGYGLIDEKNEKLQDQFTRTARFISSILKFSNKMIDGKLEEDAGKLCMSFFPKQFGTARIPKVSCDQLVYHPKSRHIVVIKGSHYFKVDLFNENRTAQLSEAEIQRQLEAISSISSTSQCEENFVGVLTTEDRDIWAKLRNQMIKEDTVNQESLHVIDSALFILVLDEQPLKDLNGRSSTTLHSDGKSCWFDKLQIFSYRDGHLGVNFEHSFSDGTIWNRWLHEVWHDMNGSKSGFNSLISLPTWNSTTKPHLLEWRLSSSIKKSIDHAVKKYDQLKSNNDVEVLDFQHYGKNTIKKWKTSPDGVAQMAFQLAFYRQHGTIPPTYESCSTRTFLHGRTETIRSATNEAKNFVETVVNKSSKDSQLQAFRDAVNMHVEIAKRAQKGMGVDRHLLALSALAAAEGKIHPFFNDKIRKMSSSFRISSSNVTMPFLQYFCFGAVDPSGYGLGYLIQDESIPVNITSFKDCKETNSKKMAKSIQDAFLDIRDINEN